MDQREPKKWQAAAEKIAHQFPPTPEGRLFAGVVRQAIQDLEATTRSNVGIETFQAGIAAYEYLKGDIWNASMCGVSSDWIRGVIEKCGIKIETPTKIRSTAKGVEKTMIFIANNQDKNITHGMVARYLGLSHNTTSEKIKHLRLSGCVEGKPLRPTQKGMDLYDCHPKKHR